MGQTVPRSPGSTTSWPHERRAIKQRSTRHDRDRGRRSRGFRTGHRSHLTRGASAISIDATHRPQWPFVASAERARCRLSPAWVADRLALSFASPPHPQPTQRRRRPPPTTPLSPRRKRRSSRARVRQRSSTALAHHDAVHFSFCRDSNRPPGRWHWRRSRPTPTQALSACGSFDCLGGFGATGRRALKSAQPAGSSRADTR
jgi:hypothetical protein